MSRSTRDRSAHEGPRPRFSYANVAATLALCLAITSPAWADPVANSAASLKKTATKALGLGKKADKRAKKALATANQALAQDAKPGPAGPQGTTGSTGPSGAAGQNGSPDTPTQVRDKLVQVDGAGSGVDADVLDSFSADDFAREDSADNNRLRWGVELMGTHIADTLPVPLSSTLWLSAGGGQFELCNSSPNALHHVRYVNGTRTDGAVPAAAGGNPGCVAFDPLVGGDFEIVFNRGWFRGSPATSSGSPLETYYVFAFGAAD
jgi:hypothetical protein